MKFPTSPYPAPFRLCASAGAASMSALSDKATAWIDRERQLVDEAMALEAQLLGKRLELAYHCGLRDDAVRLRQAMEKVIRDRRDLVLQRAEESGQDYFVAAGMADGQMVTEGLVS